MGLSLLLTSCNEIPFSITERVSDDDQTVTDQTLDHDLHEDSVDAVAALALVKLGAALGTEVDRLDLVLVDDDGRPEPAFDFSKFLG